MTTGDMSVIERFEAEYQQYHGLSEDRAKKQVKELLTFAEFAGVDSPELATAQDLHRYMSSLVEQGLHVNTVRKRGNYIKPFFTWAFGADLIDGTKLMQVRAVPNPNGATAKGLPRPYSLKELRTFWDQLDARWPHDDDKWFDRVWKGRSRYKRIASSVMRVQIEAVVALALDCGLRQTEIFNLDIEDCHYDNEYVVVKQRGARANGKDHHREVPHTSDSRTAVRNWLELRAKLKPGHDRVWLSAFANQAEGGWLKPMLPKRFELVMRTIGDWQLHRFRHTCATNWLRAGMDLEVVSRLLGHSSIHQTLGYAAIVRDDIQKQVERNEASFARMTGRNRE